MPYGNWLYTGMFQALGYNYLRQTNHQTLIILAEDEHVQEVTCTDEKQFESIMGKSIQIEEKINLLFQQKHTVNNSAVANNKALLSHLPFLRTLTDMTIVPLLIPTKTEKHPTSTETLIRKILKNNPQTAVICLSHCSTHKPLEKALIEDKKMIHKIEERNKNRRPKEKTALKMIDNIAKKEDAQRELALYGNTGEMGWSKEKTIGHCCMIA